MVSILFLALIALAFFVFGLRNNVKQLSISVEMLRDELAALRAAPEAGKDAAGAATRQQRQSQRPPEPVIRSGPVSAPVSYRATIDETDTSRPSGLSEKSKEPASAPGRPLAASPAPPAKRPPRAPLLPPGWEQRLAERWLVWLGGLAIALGGLFLVIYAAERGWLSPALRCIIGVLAGLALAAAGEWVRRRPGQLAIAALKADYVPQALTAAGLFIAYTSIYLAYGYFGILPAGAAFALLGAISFVGFGLSLLQGPYVAALGLVGAMLTPALVSTQVPNLWGLFGYLLAITAAVIAVLNYRKWWWLGIACVGLCYFWFMLWIAEAFSLSDWPVLCMFTFAVAAGFTWLSERRTPEGSPDLLSADGWYSAQGIAALAVLTGLLGVAGLALHTDHHRPILYTLAAGSALVFVLIYLRPSFTLLAAIAAAIVTVLIMAWPVGVPDIWALWDGYMPSYAEPIEVLTADRSIYALVSALFSAIFLIGGYLCLRRTTKPLWVVVPSLAVPLVLLLFTNLRFGLITQAAPLSGAALILAGLAAFATWRLLPLTTDTGIRHCAGVYAAACATFVTVALSLVLDEAALTVAMALLVLAISLAWRWVPLRILWSFTLALATVVVIRLTFNPFIFDYARTAWLGEHWVLYGFGLSAIVFYLAAQVFRKSDDDELVMALESGALVFAVLLVTYEVRIFIEGSISARNYGFLEMSVQSVSWLTSAYGLIIRNSRTPRFFTLWGSRILLAIAGAQVLILQVLVNNPALTGEQLKGFFPADSLLLAYLAPAVLLWFIVPRLPAVKLASFQDHFAGFAAALVFVYVTLEVRHIFQGATIFVSHDSNLELYVTTLAWFALGGVMLTVPLLKANDMLVRCGKAIVALALLMVVAGHIGVFNPVLTGLPAPGVAIFNILLLGFALPAIGLAVAARLSPGTTLEDYRDHLGIAAYAIGFAYLTLEVRRFFHGRFMDVGAIGDAEYYGYSLVWLIYALAVLLVGMWLKRSMIRHAALAVLVLVVLKVFLSDMAGLGGLYRVASFMGLGLSLVGIGYLYQRFVFTGSSETADAQTGG